MRNLFLIVTVVLCISNAGRGAIQPVWTRTYNSPQYNTTAALERDSQGNVLTLIQSEGNVALVKYSAAGTVLWTNHFDSSFEDVPTGLVMTPDDSAIATIVSMTNSVLGRLVLLKVSSDGTTAWQRGDLVVTGSPSATPSVTTDSSGNIFCAGITPAGYVLTMYDPSGSPQWTNSHAVPEGYFASTKYFGVDTDGNVLLVGALSHLGIDQILFLKCSATGLLRSTVQAWPAPNDFLTSASQDSAGNLYTCASIQPNGSGPYHLEITKYDRDLNPIWSKQRAPAPGFYHAVSHRIRVTSSGDLVVSGYEMRTASEDEDEYQTLVLKYSSGGEQLWSARVQSFDRRPTGLALDDRDLIYLLSGDSVGQSCSLTCYRTNGSQAGEIVVPDHSSGQLVTGATGEVYANFSSGATTRKFLLTESPNPLIALVTPAIAEVLPGSSVTFTAAVSGIGPFVYEWRYQGFKTGGTNSTFTIDNAQFAWRSQGDYTVVVSNATDWTMSPEAHLEVFRAPEIRLNSNIQYVTAGQAGSIGAIVSGTGPITLSWFQNGRPIPGASGTNLIFSPVAPTNAGAYTLLASNLVGTVTSQVSILHVVQTPITFANEERVLIPTNGAATPYPSEIIVSGITDTVVKLSITLDELNSVLPFDLQVLLQAPGGRGILLMSSVGDDATANGITLTFDDEATDHVPDDVIPSGIYRPGYAESTPLPAPAPLPPWETRIADLNAGDPNGVWRLFAFQRNRFGTQVPGELNHGWHLTFLLADPVTTAAPTIARITVHGSQVSIQWDGVPGWGLQQSDSLEQPDWKDVPGTVGLSAFTTSTSATNRFFRIGRARQ